MILYRISIEGIKTKAMQYTNVNYYTLKYMIEEVSESTGKIKEAKKTVHLICKLGDIEKFSTVWVDIYTSIYSGEVEMRNHWAKSVSESTPTQLAARHYDLFRESDKVDLHTYFSSQLVHELKAKALKEKEQDALKALKQKKR